MSDTPDAPAPAPGPAAAPVWHSSATRTGAAGRAAFSGRDTKLVLLAAVALGLLGAAGAWALYFRPMTAPVFYSLAVREYADPRLPPNPFAVQDGELLLAAFAGVRQQGYENQGREQFDKVLNGLRGRRDGPVVVHLCALARADDKQVYLLPGDAAADDPAGWLPLAHVLDALRDCPAGQKLLLLDVMRPLADARLGLLSDEVAERVHAQLTAYEPTFPVLCACGPRQHSLVSEEWRHSAFAHFVRRGLEGAAEGQGEHGRADARITVGELAAYLKPRVDRWALDARGERQTPVLFGADAADFPLVQVTPRDETGEAKEPEKYPDWLTAGWQRRDDGRRADADRWMPHLVRRLEDALLRADRRWRAGIEPDRIRRDLAGTLDLWDDAAKRARPAAPAVPSLAGAAAGLPAPDAKAQEALDDAQAALSALLPRVPDPAAPAGEAEKARLAEFAKVRKEVVDRLQKQPFPLAAARVFDAVAAAQNVTPNMVVFAHELLRELPAGPTTKTRYVETVFLDRLLEFTRKTKEYGWGWPTDAVHQSLRTTRTSQALLARLALEPAATPWVAPLVEPAEARRRSAEKLLFASEKTNVWPEAVTQFGQAEQFYESAAARLALLQEARRLRDRAYAALPGWADYLEARGDADAALAAWQEAAEGGRELADLLARPAPEQLAGGAPDPVRRVRSALDALGGAERAWAKENLANLDYLDLQALLDSPLPTAARRGELFALRQELGRKLNAADEADKRDRPQRPRSSTAGHVGRTVRGEAMLGLLKLAGDDGIVALQQEWRDVNGEKDTPEAWAKLSGALAGAWSRSLPDRYQARATDAATRDAIGRILPLAEGSATPSPAAARERDAAAAFRALLARLYAVEAASLAVQEDLHADFFAEAADNIPHGRHADATGKVCRPCTPTASKCRVMLNAARPNRRCVTMT